MLRSMCPALSLCLKSQKQVQVPLYRSTLGHNHMTEKSTSTHLKIVPVILSGGAGTRLWPISRAAYPKQFIGIVHAHTPVIQETLARVGDPDLFHPPVMIGSDAHRFLLAEHMKTCGIAQPEILIEPCARSTAPAIAAAALYVKQRYGNNALMLVLPTDHYFSKDISAFLSGVRQAAEAANSGALVTFGIAPDHPATGYGYIRRGEARQGRSGTYAIASFVEKPDLENAKSFLDSGQYYWNSGMFLFPVEALLTEIHALQPALLAACEQALEKSTRDLDFIRLDEGAFSKCPDISIDYAVMEHTRKGAVVELDCGWSDAGAWDLLWQLSDKDANGNAVLGERCYPLESKNCYIRSENGPGIATFGVENLVVVATKDAVLVADKSKSDALKTLVAHVKEKDPELVRDNYRTYRPWGMYESLQQGPRFQVKRLSVKPGQKLSLQMHHHRAEHWVVVSGTGKMTCDDITRIVTENESFHVPQGSKHSIENPGEVDLDIIEVQSGSYLGEDDIVRFEDRYGRIPKKQ